LHLASNCKFKLKPLPGLYRSWDAFIISIEYVLKEANLALNRPVFSVRVGLYDFLDRILDNVVVSTDIIEQELVDSEYVFTELVEEVFI